MRTIVIGAALIASLIAPARANSQLSGDQAVVAMAIDTAMFAAGHCPGLRYVKSAMFPNVQAAGQERSGRAPCFLAKSTPRTAMKKTLRSFATQFGGCLAPIRPTSSISF